MDEKMKNLLVLFFAFLLALHLAYALNINSIDIPAEVKSGDIFSVTLKLENNEDDTIRNVNIDLKLNDLPFKIISQEGIDRITRNNEKTLSLVLQALPGSLSKTYTIPATITYKLSETINKKETSFVVIVNDRAILDVTARSDILIKGEKSTVTIKIVNKGLGDVKFLNAEINSASLIFISEKQQYIGTLSSDDFDSVDFEVITNKNSPSIIILNVILNYEDITGNKYTETKTIELRNYDKREAESLGLIERNNTPLIIAGAVILVILFFIYRRIRKRKK
ncbi:hypothetical protein HYV49_05680 [Candidatus Pacearchaeota archaeon]|nr:hypothetical protein [Candidatus Pacearchaeota archaeon]